MKMLEWQSIVMGLLSVLLTVALFWLRANREDFKELQKEVMDLRMNSISKDTLERELDIVSRNVDQKHQENRGAWERQETAQRKYDRGMERIRHNLADNFHSLQMQNLIVANKLGVQNEPAFKSANRVRSLDSDADDEDT